MSSRYVPLFSEIVDSSLWLEEDMVCKVFLTMLAKSDRDHVVRGTALAIARWSNKTEAEVLKALEVLASPDKQRLEPQPFDGRRIERVADGWLLLNGAKYQARMIEYNKRVYNANAQRAYRARVRGENPRNINSRAYRKQQKTQLQRVAEDAAKQGDMKTLGRVQRLEDGLPPTLEQQLNDGVKDGV